MNQDSPNENTANSAQARQIAQVAVWLKAAIHGAALTGAGISKESGIPTFRDKLTGLWAQYDPSDLATPSGFARNPALVWQWYDHRRNLVGEASPNAGHLALAELQDLLPQFTVITQNVDRLHERAGSRGVLELHGDILTFRCFNRGHAAAEVALGLEEPPACAYADCRSLLRPNVVWFGESLSPDVLSRATRLASTCEVFLVIGTSGLVQPAASLPIAAKRGGAKLVEINPEPTALTDQVDIFLQGAAGVILPALVAQLKGL